MFTNTGGTQQAYNQPDLDGQPKMGEELKSQRSPRQGVLSSSSHKSELASVSSKWQIWTTLSLPFLAVLLQLVWEHRGGNSQLAEGPIVPLALAWLVPRHRLLPPPGVLLTLPLILQVPGDQLPVRQRRPRLPQQDARLGQASLLARARWWRVRYV